jgi:DNA repair protein SbcC/Rad50
MIVTRIELENFRSYAEAEIMPPTSGLTLIQGPNGAGKSSLISAAVLWCLFGESPDGVAIKELRRQGTLEGEATSVTVTIQADGREVTVYRALKGKNLTTIAEVTVDGVPMTDVKSGAATAFVEGLLGVDAVGFKTAYLVQQKSLDSLVRQTAASRKKTIERLSGVEKLAQAVEEARASARAAQKVAQTYESATDGVDGLTEKMSEANQALVDAITEHSDASGRLERRVATHNETLAALRAAETEARELIAAKSAYESLMRELAQMQDKQQRGLAKLEEEKSTLLAAHESLDEARKGWPEGRPVVQVDLSEQNQELGALRAERQRLMDEIAALDGDGEDRCPTCGQATNTNRLKKETNDKLESVVERGVALAAEVKATTEANTLAAAIEAAQAKVYEREASVHRVQEALDEVNDMVRSLEEKAELTPPVEYDENRLTELAEAEKAASEEVKSAQAAATRAQAAVSAAERDALTAENAFNMALENESKRKQALSEHEVATSVASALERFRAHRLAALAPALSESASDYLSILTEGALTAITLSDDFEPVITAADGTSRPVAMLSGGEESLVALALRLAIGDEVISGDGSLLVLDEILGALDEDRRTMVTRTLRDLGRQVFLVHHGDTEFADGVYTITPTPNGAVVEAG